MFDPIVMQSGVLLASDTVSINGQNVKTQLYKLGQGAESEFSLVSRDNPIFTKRGYTYGTVGTSINQSRSGLIQTDGWSMLRFVAPDALTAAAVGWEVSQNGTDWYTLADETDTAIVRPITINQAYAMPAECAGWGYVRFVSYQSDLSTVVAEAAARTWKWSVTG